MDTGDTAGETRAPTSPLTDPLWDTLFTNVSDAILLANDEGRFIAANPAARTLLGYSPDELRDKTFFEMIVSQPGAVPLAEGFQRFLALGSRAGEVTLRRRDGTHLTVQFRAFANVRPGVHAALFVGGGQLQATAAELARKRAEAETSVRVQRAIGDAIEYGSWVCDLDGRNVYASPSFLALVGMTQEQCSNFGWGDVLHPDDAAETIAAWKECSRTGTRWERSHRFKGADGQWHHVLARGVPVRDDDGKILCWAGLNIDVSHLKATEERLRSSEENLRQADRRKDDLLAMISHDLQNPLGVIGLNLQLLSRQSPPGEPGEKTRKWVTTAQRAVQTMQRLVHDLLATSAIEHGRLRLIIEVRDAAQIVREATDDLRPLALEKGLRLEGSVEPADLRVKCDLERIAQVFGNAIGNAIKFTASGGSIVVRGVRDGELALFSVSDNGGGIAPAYLPRIFDPYWQEKPGRRGIGLGLFIARGIVEAHGGKIWAESVAGRGTTLSFTLPAA